MLQIICKMGGVPEESRTEVGVLQLSITNGEAERRGNSWSRIQVHQIKPDATSQGYSQPGAHL